MGMLTNIYTTALNLGNIYTQKQRIAFTILAAAFHRKKNK